MPESVLTQVHVVLFEPQDPVNIAAVIRAMKNMGVSSLRLVRPVEYDAYRLEGIAHDAAYTARRRAAKRVVTSPRQSALDVLAAASRGPAALLFGREDKGLPNEALDRARVVVNIPTTAHASLNLAQAVLVALYELHVAAGDATRVIRPPRDDAPLAT